MNEPIAVNVFRSKLKYDPKKKEKKNEMNENSRFAHSLVSLIENRYLFIFGNIIPFSAFIAFREMVCRSLRDRPTDRSTVRQYDTFIYSVVLAPLSFFPP